MSFHFMSIINDINIFFDYEYSKAIGCFNSSSNPSLRVENMLK